MKKIGTYLLATVLLLSLAACAPKRYERKHGPVDSSSARQSSGKADEKQKKASQMKRMRKRLAPCLRRTRQIFIPLSRTVRL